MDDILPREKDLLISLPTGSGKSLLFPGPALFRSGFTGRLSVVICPLKALMRTK
ncbi:MAG: DEAD/DEAH box helicase [Bacteroidetes bacterium]|nr:DEAD/DEAH box helicase [Bacteroidota bacterium]